MMNPKLEQLRDFLAGRADAETRQRIATELEDPESELSILLRGAHEVAGDLLHRGGDAKPKVRKPARKGRRTKEKALLRAASNPPSDAGAEPRRPEDYLNSLGIGDFSGRWKDVTGKGQCVCVVGSGVDESHPALRGQVRAHALFDRNGNYTEAPHAFDRGAHRTALAGVIAARTVLRSDLALDGEGCLRLGLAPECQIVAVGVMGGVPGRETGSLPQVLAGLDWAVEHQHHPTLGGYEVVLIGMEISSGYDAQCNRVLDDFLDYMRACGLVPLLAAGNRGAQSTPLGTRGLYVGACNIFGRPWEYNGRAHLLAAGVDLLCCQPNVPELGGNLVGRHTGTSLAAAVVAGAIVLLREITGRTAEQCADALRIASKGNTSISLDAAYDWLRARKNHPHPAPERPSPGAPRLREHMERVRADPAMGEVNFTAT